MWRCEHCNLRVTFALRSALGPVCPNCEGVQSSPGRPISHVTFPRPSEEPPAPDPLPGSGHVVLVDASYDDGLAGIAAVADGHDEIVRMVRA